MTFRARRLAVAAVICGALAAPAAAVELRVASAAPQGVLEGDEQQRIRIVFSAAMVPLGEAATTSAPPPWLAVEPSILARWRWAGTAELVGEPLAALPRATRYRVTVAGGTTAVTGAALAAAYAFEFTTPLPGASVFAVEGDLDEVLEHRWYVHRRPPEDGWPLAPGQVIALAFEQPIDPASLAERLTVRIAPRPLEGAAELLDAEQIARLEKQDPQGHAGWRRFLEASRGAPEGDAAFTLRPHAGGSEVFLLEPHGCWPRAAQVALEIAPGVRSLEGPERSADQTLATFVTPHPPAPLRFAGREATRGGGFDPEGLSLVFASDVVWRDVAESLSFRALGAKTWRTAEPFPEEWMWSWENTSLDLGPLGLEGGKEYEVCVAAGAIDAYGGELEFPWCGRARTAHRAAQLYLVEGDGVVEWHGPHLIPLRVLNVTSIAEQHRRVAEEELVGVLAAREKHTFAEPARRGRAAATKAPVDQPALRPLDLAPVLAGKPGIVLSRLVAVDAVAGSEYEGEARRLREPRTAVTQVTSLGLAVKASGYEGIQVWVTSLADARPVAGAAITVRDEANGVLWRGVSNASGLARSPAEVSLGSAFIVTARLGDDLAYARTRWWEGHRGWEFNLPVDYERERPVIGRVWSDRGVVRPGESVRLKAVVRRREDLALRVPARSEATFVVRDPRGEDALVRTAPFDAWGGAEVELTVPEQAALGSWDVMVGGAYDADKRTFLDGEAWQVSGSVRVAEFRRPKFRLAATAERDRLVAGDPLSVTFAGQLLAGGALAGAPTRWAVRASRWGWRPAASRWAGFEFAPEAFGDGGFERETVETLAQGEGELDAAGRLEVRLPRAEALKGWPATLEVEAEARDVDRQSSAARTRVAVLPAEVLLGVERPPFFVTATAGVATRIVALSPAETPVAGVAIRVELQRRHWESVRRREVSGRYVFESRPVVTTVASQEIASAGEPMAVRFPLADGGEYALLATARDGRGNEARAAFAFYVFGAGYTPWRMDRENRIELVAEHDEWSPGETARVLVKSPWERTTALVTVERAGVLAARVEELAGTMPVIEVPIEPSYAPNVFVSVMLLRGRVEAPPDSEMVDPGRPAYRIGYCELSVPPRSRRLAVTVTAAKPEYRPGQPAEAAIQVTGADGAPRRAGVTVWAVDAGVLELTGFRTPDLIAVFYARAGLGVTTAESRSRLVGRRSYGTKGDRHGGGGGVEAAAEAMRRDFRALAVWQGDVVTDGDGRARIAFTLPDALTTYRLMAVACAGEQEFGAGDSEFRVSKPLGLEPALPRVLRVDDRARAAVVVRNRTNNAQEVEVTVAIASGPLKLRGGATRVANVAAGGSSEVGFGVIATAPGAAVLRFSAATAGTPVETDAMEVPLAVVAIAPVETTAAFFSTSARAEESIAVPENVYPTAGGLEVSLAGSALVEAGPAVAWLSAYPHSCAEQASSRLLGITAARRLGPGYAPEEIDGEPPAARGARDVARIVACRRSDGGFGFWPGGGPSHPVLSAYAVWALAEAAAAGMAVEPAVLEQAARYLSLLLRHERFAHGEGDGWTIKLLASFALVRLDKPEPAYFQWLFDRRGDERPLWGRALLAATMAEVNGADPRVAVLVQELANRLAVEARAAHLEEPVPEWGWWTFWGAGRGDAAALLALLAAEPGGPLPERLVRGVLDRLARDRERTTHDTAWMLQALAAYREKRESATGRRTATATLAGAALLRADFTSGAPGRQSARVPMVELQRRASGRGRTLPLAVGVEGEGEVHGTALLSYAPRGAGRPALAHGLAVERRLLDAAGRAVAGVRAGEEVTVEVELDLPATRRFLVVEIPLPAGLEALDPGLATTRRPSEEEKYGETADDEGFWWEPGFDRVELRDDRIVLYATELPAGRHRHRVTCRATTSGTFALPAGRAEEMYAPEVFATTEASQFEVFPVGR